MIAEIRIYSFLCLLIFVFISCNNDFKKNNKVEGKHAVFQNVLDSIYNEHEGVLGIMAHIEAPNKNISWSGAVGVSNKQTKANLESDQPVLIASNTKTYVAVSILKLIEQGELKLDDPVFKYISNTSKNLLNKEGYNVYNITIRDLMSHTSGIYDYAETEAYFNTVLANPKKQWSRIEQIKFAMEQGDPLGNPGDVFAYSDTNYLLLTEVIESVTNKEFYKAIKELIDYPTLHLNKTWFSTLESYPNNVKPMAYQYISSANLDSYGVSHTFDLFGGGGIASTPKDLALFFQNVFNNKVFKNEKTLELLRTKANPKKKMKGEYFLGLTSVEYNAIKGYGHNGFWGTAAFYFPELDASIAIVILEQDQKHLRVDINKALVKALRVY